MNSQKLCQIQTFSRRPVEWVHWEDAARSALKLTTLRHANYVGSREVSQMLTRKVQHLDRAY